MGNEKDVGNMTAHEMWLASPTPRKPFREWVANKKQADVLAQQYGETTTPVEQTPGRASED